jgi:hypothetical protein
MTAKVCIAGALALVLLPCQALAQTLGTTTSFVVNPYIEKLSCDGGSGTGFKLDTGQWISVNHVTSLGNCRVNGLKIVVTYDDFIGDFSTFTIPGDRRVGGLKADCGGYQNGQWYYGTGHARGLPILTSVPVLYAKAMNLKLTPRGWAILIYNRFIPGESGGPVLNTSGRVTGTVNAYSPEWPISFSRQLRDTIICKG